MYDVAKLFVPFTRYPYRGRIIPCPVCGAASHVKVAGLDRRYKRLPTVMCSTCGLLYTNPMPTDEELSVYYSRYYRFDYQMAVSAPKPKHIRKRNNEALGRIEALSGLLEPGAPTLDFGCGSGEFVAHMVERGFDAHGFEPGETYGSHARKLLGERIRIAAWQEVEYDRRFDLVTCFHVLEHLNTPLPALSRMVSWLTPGGKIYIEVPDLAPERSRKGFGFFHFAHVIGFNHWNLILAAARVGLAPVRIVAPTGVIFAMGEGEPQEKLAAKGLELTASNFVEASPYRRYFAYQRGKLLGRR